MINRAPTRIELKLDDDIIDYEETQYLRKNNIQKENEFSPMVNEEKNGNFMNYNNNLNNINNVSSFSPHPVNLAFSITKQNSVSGNKFNPQSDLTNSNSSLGGDISMR